MRALILFLLASAASADGYTARSPDLEAYLGAVDQAEAAMAETCAALEASRPQSGAAWLRVGPKGLELAPTETTEAETAAFWADLALGARDAARALYGGAAAETLANGPVLVELSPAAVSVFNGESREGGDLCTAMRRLTGALGDGASAPFASARAAAASPAAAPLPIGGGAEMALDAPLDGDAVLRGPDGVAAALADDGATIALAAAADATPGDGMLRIYDPANPFRPTQEIPLRILPGSAEPLPARQTGAISPGGAFAGALPLGGEVALDLALNSEQRITLSASSDADLTVTVFDAAGAPIMRDDDSGEGYTFSVSNRLDKGVYTVRVAHCCGGGGAFAITATSE